jgi:hypothetical protein
LQELLGPLDVAGDEVLVRGQSGGPIELPGEAVGTEAGDSGPLLRAGPASRRSSIYSTAARNLARGSVPSRLLVDGRDAETTRIRWAAIRPVSTSPSFAST